MRVLLCAIVVTACVACSSSSSSSPDSSRADSGSDDAGTGATPDSSTDDAGVTPDSPTDSEAAEAAPLSADCQRLYNCCVGAATQTPQFCTGLVGQNICGTWLGSYAMAGIQCP
jgi:hypothetical protein